MSIRRASAAILSARVIPRYVRCGLVELFVILCGFAVMLMLVCLCLTFDAYVFMPRFICSVTGQFAEQFAVRIRNQRQTA